MLLTTGATVYITARDAAKGDKALSKLKAGNPGPGSVHLLVRGDTRHATSSSDL